MKFGEEARPSNFATRLVWACGYTVETEYLLASGRIEGAHHLKRAGSWVHKGVFVNGRFQLRSKTPKFVTDHSWAWNSNAFRGSQELNGLKILVMLLSNWDTKDARDFDSSSHEVPPIPTSAIFEDAGEQGPRYTFFISDWGASMGSGAARRPAVNGIAKDTPPRRPTSCRAWTTAW